MVLSLRPVVSTIHNFWKVNVSIKNQPGKTKCSHKINKLQSETKEKKKRSEPYSKN